MFSRLMPYFEYMFIASTYFFLSLALCVVNKDLSTALHHKISLASVVDSNDTKS